MPESHYAPPLFDQVFPRLLSTKRFRPHATLISHQVQFPEEPFPFGRADPKVPILPSAQSWVIAAAVLPNLAPKDSTRRDQRFLEQLIAAEFGKPHTPSF